MIVVMNFAFTILWPSDVMKRLITLSLPNHYLLTSIKIWNCSFTKMHLKLSLTKCRSFCSGLSVYVCGILPLFLQRAFYWTSRLCRKFSPLAFEKPYGVGGLINCQINLVLVSMRSIYDNWLPQRRVELAQCKDTISKNFQICSLMSSAC